MSFNYPSRQLLLHCSTSCIPAVDPSPERALKSQQGFTLLEMVLVLLIMGMVASLSVVFIDNEDNQLRYEESVQKLEVMHKATVTVKDYKDDFLLSGFVVDNGVLPSDAQEFISIPKDEVLGARWISLGETYIDDTTDPLNPVRKHRIQPYFRLTKKDLLTDIDYPAPDRGYVLLPDIPVGIKAKVKAIYYRKGYRSGYIGLGIDSMGNYKDAWGDDFIVNEVSRQLNGEANQQLNLAINVSEKSDDTANFIGDNNGYDIGGNPVPIPDDISDINRNILESDWGVSLSDLQISIENRTGIPIDTPIVGIIVFNNEKFLRPSTGDELEICKECLKTYHFKETCPLEPNPTDEKVPLVIVSSTSNSWELSCTETTPPNFNCIKSISPDPILNPTWQTEALDKTEFEQIKCVHTDNVDQGIAKNVIIPAGEHIVFVGEDTSASSDGKLDEIKAQAILKIIPRFDTNPTVTLVIE